MYEKSRYENGMGVRSVNLRWGASELIRAFSHVLGTGIRACPAPSTRRWPVQFPPVTLVCAMLAWPIMGFGGHATTSDAVANDVGHLCSPLRLVNTEISSCWLFGVPPLNNAELVEVNLLPGLYRQRHLLDQALTALLPRDPSKINLYLLAVAGDASQEVFRREVDFVRDQFERNFGTKGKAIALINSRNTFDTIPMATVTNIHLSLKSIAAKMDKEKDILFVYLSSHGSREHELFLNHDKMRLRSLSANELAALLKDSDIRWKVIVVSACYSGGFIDPLKDDRTLIITAARHDRPSFGCADDSIFTRFGEAFFKNALPQSASFQDAFGKARLLIEEQEARLVKSGDPASGESASLPQMYNPALIEQYLKKWWAQTKR